MRFGIKTAPQMTTWQDLRDVWVAADDIDVFDGAWNFDHFYPIHGNPLDGPCLEAWTMLAAMAEATHRIRLGVMVTGNIYRHPAVLANMACTLDVISGGRLDLGIGAGWNEDETAAYGIPLPPLTERFDRLDEACEILVGLMTRHTFSHDGEYYQLSDAHCAPKAIQTPHPPICIGGDGEKRTLRAVARYAQIWNAPFTDPDHLAGKLAVLQRHCDDVGRDISEIRITAHVLYDADAGPQATADECARLRDAGLDEAIVYLPTPHTPAVLEPLAAAVAPLVG